MFQFEASDGEHRLRAVEQRNPLLRLQRQRVKLGSAQRFPARHDRAFVLGLAFADHHQRHVGERGEIATGADASTRGDHRRDAAVEEVAQSFRDQGADAGESAGQYDGADQHHGSGLGAREGFADARGVRADHVALKRGEIVGGNADVGKQADAGVDGVHGVVTSGEFFDHGAGAAHGFDRGGSNSDKGRAARDFADLGEGETVTRKQDHK